MLLMIDNRHRNLEPSKIVHTRTIYAIFPL